MNNYFLILSLKNDWITFIFLLIFILLVLVKLIYKERLFLLSLVGVSKKYFLKYGKDNQLIFNGFNLVLFIVQTLIGMLIVYAFLYFYSPRIVEESSFLFLKIFIRRRSSKAIPSFVSIFVCISCLFCQVWRCQILVTHLVM